MKSGFFQFPVVFGDREANFQRIQDGLKDAEFDLLVLPELCTTGYLYASREELARYAESARDGITVAFLLALSKLKQATIIAGIAERDGEDIYNTAIVVSHGRWLGKQRKCHLTRIEKKIFSAGSSLSCFDNDLCRFGVLTCFDLWIPEAARLLARDGAQLFCSPVNYGGPWTSDLVRIRAMENATYLISCNRTGHESRAGIDAHFRGESQIIGAMGDVLLKATGDTFLGLCDIDPHTTRIKANVMCDDLMAEALRYDLSGPSHIFPK
ncbi:MAG: hypothetical protein NWQ13_10965 [Glaciimonas sp.]|nr:hypothetical protein [Glaciimonas sp.]